MLFAAFWPHPFICICDALAVPSVPGTLHQRPSTLGAAEDVAVEQISVTTSVADFVSTKPESLASWQWSWSCTLSGEPQPASIKGKAVRWPMEPGSPGFSITMPRASGDVGQPCKPLVILKRFDNVTYPCVCTSVIERDIGQIWSVWLWLMLSLSWPSCH